jgi:hypothetical protein
MRTRIRKIDIAFIANRLVHLGYLVTLHQIWICVLFTIELRDSGDVAVSRHSNHHGVLDSRLVYDGESAGQCHADFVDERIWLGSLVLGAGRAEHFATCLELHMSFETNYCFVLHEVVCLFLLVAKPSYWK